MLGKGRRKPVGVILTGGLLAILTVVGLRMGGALEFLELAAYDMFIRIIPKQSLENPWITIIEVSEKDIQDIGHWPLSDETIATALEIILRAEPRAVGLDIYRDIPVPPGSESLNRIFKDNPQLIGVMIAAGNEIKPLEAIRGTDQAAFGDILVDPGGIVRRGLLFLDDGQTVYTSFPLRLASTYLADDAIHLQPDPENPSFVRIGKTTIRPLDEDAGGYSNLDARGYQYLLDYRDAGQRFRAYSISNLLSGQVPVQAIAGRIVLIGVKSHSVKDYFFTPLSRGLSDGQQVAGIDLQGYMVSQLLRFAMSHTVPVQLPSEAQKAFWILFWGFWGAILGSKIRSALRFVLLVACGLLILVCSAFGFFMMCWWIPLVPPASAFVLAAGGVMAYMTGHEQRERAALMQIFAKHVSQEVADMIWDQRAHFLSGGRPKSQNMVATVFFSDMKGFTTLSEKLAPAELMNWLNTYMEAMAGLIMQFGGVVDSYAGDGIKADFGVPIPRQNQSQIARDAVNAVSCALAMEQEMARLNSKWDAEGLSEIGIRVGIYTGPVVGGLLGSSRRLKYTTIGDTVNIASRLESFDKKVSKHSPCRILIGDATLAYLDKVFETQQIGEVKLKGKEEVITIYQVLGTASDTIN